MSLLFLSFFCLCFLFSVSSSQAARSSATPRPPSPFSSPKSNNQNQQPNQQYQCNANAMQCKCSAGLPQVPSPPPRPHPAPPLLQPRLSPHLLGWAVGMGAAPQGFCVVSQGSVCRRDAHRHPTMALPSLPPTRGDGCCIIEDIAAANKVPSRRKRGPERVLLQLCT